MVDLTTPPDTDTLIDYLTPPSPTFQNFPLVQNNSPFPAPSNNENSLQNSFLTGQQTAFSNINPTVSDVNSPASIITPSNNFPTNNAPGFVDPNSNFGNPPLNFATPQSREISNNFGSDQQIGSNSPQVNAPPQGKWDLGFDPSDILNPPIYDPQPNTGIGDYETLSLNTFSRRPAVPPVISSSASSNTPVLALNPTHSQFTIHGSLRANEQGQSIIWGTFKPSPFATIPAPSAAASNDHLRYSSQLPDNYTPSYLSQGTATDSFIPPEDPSSSFLLLLLIQKKTITR
ncbi:hypothetical protein WDU94_009800 [Cyamophila willieti]